jgi:ribosome-associated translation inhibitor RaiA
MPKVDMYARCDAAIATLRRRRTKRDPHRDDRDHESMIAAIDSEIRRLERALGDVILLEKIFGSKK